MIKLFTLTFANMTRFVIVKRITTTRSTRMPSHTFSTRVSRARAVLTRSVLLLLAVLVLPLGSTPAPVISKPLVTFLSSITMGTASTERAGTFITVGTMRPPTTIGFFAHISTDLSFRFCRSGLPASSRRGAFHVEFREEARDVRLRESAGEL